jgi:3-phenylpropionate/trans-cinnamate dioxygenase ferredoxin subunit
MLRPETIAYGPRRPMAHADGRFPAMIEVVATRNGPLLITGDLSQIELRDGDGNLYELAGRRRVFLCRCGASATKPFCDGHHTKIGFAAAETVVDIPA